MKYVKLVVALAFVVSSSVAHAGAEDRAIKDNPGYNSGASNSGKSGMDSSRGVPTTPTSGGPGTTENGNPSMKRGSSR